MSDRPLYSSYLVGWREWTLDAWTHHLTSWGGTRWPSRQPLESKCAPGVGPPSKNCTCGIYAFRDEKDLLGQFCYLGAYGRVALWGVVIEHELGWRAQFAYPLELWTCKSGAVEALAELYEVPVHHADVSILWG